MLENFITGLLALVAVMIGAFAVLTVVKLYQGQR